MDTPAPAAEVSVPPHIKKAIPRKRSFGKYPRSVDSPAYDASEEDNDPLTDDGNPVTSLAVKHSAKHHPTMSKGLPRRHQLASSVVSEDSDGIDSPTYDGDIESSTTAGPDPTSPRTPHHQHLHHHHHTSSTSTLSLADSSAANTPSIEHKEPAFRSFLSSPLTEPSVATASRDAFDPAALTPEDIRAFVQTAISGETWRKYTIAQPPTDRPIRIYADGVYDLFHFGHALQLRQAKLSFPSVYLLVGVCSDELVHSHKARTVMTHAERLEAVRHCRWVDQVVPEAPWILDQAFLDKYEIDYVAHDEDPYGAAGHEDVYSYVKSQGKFIPTRRTPGVSTSELLERIVAGYRRRDFDSKLVKMGHAELCAEGSDYDDMSSRAVSRSVSRSMSPSSPPPGLASTAHS
ncbi:hypothetical protein CYLTODRAFT_420862 [Cylindrobasidium torrendii FP15055 ss-10]|uniref:choline-phosphate cytidylyltransferase n=1 Tax=Cylindrobasidium torrendii FP15055 ss-10 TaxID=1314674 RepID=A0A0D7BGL6_9AGAR|nr:hypothetical protein CYLTODRAFT_420862 [Cylindrobasidium torrendii FP15055 ss-10]